MNHTVPHLQRAEFEKIVNGGKDLVLFFYKKNDAASILGINTMNEVNSLLGKSFDLYMIDSESEPEICEAFSIEKIPEYITMKGCKIFKRNADILSVSEVLSMLK